MKKNTTVSIVIGVCMDNRGIVLRFFAEVRDFFSSPKCPQRLDVKLTAYPTQIRGEE